jgi:hypothetical protein
MGEIHRLGLLTHAWISEYIVEGQLMEIYCNLL